MRPMLLMSALPLLTVLTLAHGSEATPAGGRPVLAAGSVSAADPATETTYQVVQGDTLKLIARRFTTSVGWLIERNRLAGPGAVKPGRVLVVPLPKSEGELALQENKEKREKVLRNISAVGAVGYDGDVIKDQVRRTLEREDANQRKLMDMAEEQDK